jgi:hypothetical protein
MPFTAQEILQAENSLLNFNKKGITEQTIQVRPLYDDLIKSKKTFPGGKEFITMRVNGQFPVTMSGYSHDDEQAYQNPATIKQAKCKWYEMSAGISMTLTELKMYGISVVDSLDSAKTTTHTEAEQVALVDILQYKLNQLDEGAARSLAEMCWRDGTQDAKAIPGITSFIVESPTVGTRFGIDAGIESYWRNRASLAIDSSTASNQNLVTKLQSEFRQLRRFGTPKHKFYAGSDFLEAFEKELRSKGNYTMEGWSKSGRIDASVADLAFKGVELTYEPLLDDLGRGKYGYVLDMNSINLWGMDGEWMKNHTPARPPEKYVMYRAITCTGGLCAGQLNTSGVYSIL